MADGIGGHYAGHQASEIISRDLASWWDRHYWFGHTLSSAEAARQLKQVLDESCAAIRAQTPAGLYSGSTIVLLWIYEKNYLLLSAGDSRCYRVRSTLFHTDIRQLGQDDVYRPRGDGDAAFQDRLTNAVDSSCELHLAVQTGEMKPNTLFALCSDGVYRCCQKTWLSNSLAQAARFGQIESALKKVDRHVCGSGAPDNYSLVLVRYTE